jgi:hypothetical protein
MALKPKKTDDKPSLPAAFDEMLLKGFSFAAIADVYKKAGEEVRSDIKDYINDNEDDFEMSMSTALKTDYGTVTMKSGTSYAWNIDEIIKLVENGTITLASLLNGVSFTASDMKTILGEKNMAKVCTQSDRAPSLELKCSAEFKESVAEKFKELLPKDEKPKAKVEVVEAKTKVEAEATKPKVDKKKASSAAAKARSLVTKKTSVEDDLESIIGD